MKDRPIIMSGDNPKLILEDRKNQTRRLFQIRKGHVPGDIEPLEIKPTKNGQWIATFTSIEVSSKPFDCPFGIAGDRLWVREKFCPLKIKGNNRGNSYATFPDGGQKYRDGAYYVGDDEFYAIKWTPSIHMPRWASRITLEILKVRVERLQDISEEDAKAEGMPNRHDVFHYSIQSAITNNHIRNYAVLWDSLHGKGAWDKNPFVWVLEFRRLDAS